MKKVGLIGLGWVANRIWIPAFRSIDDVRIVGGYDPDPAAQEAAAGRWSGLDAFGELDELLDRSLDLVVICAPNAFHCDLAKRALERSLSVVIEKPLCTGLAELRQLAALAGRNRSHVFYSRALRHRHDVARLKTALAGCGQTVRHCELTWMRANGIPDRGSWFTNRTLAGGGVTMDLGSHMLDLGLWLMSFPAIDGVSATMSSHYLDAQAPEGGHAATWKAVAPSPAAHPIDVEDTSFCFVSTACGRSLYLKLAWASELPHDVSAIRAYTDDGILDLITTFGASPDRVPTPSLSLRRGQVVEQQDLDHSKGEEYRRHARALLAALDRPPDNAAFLEESRTLVGVLEGLYASGREPRSASRVA